MSIKYPEQKKFKVIIPIMVKDGNYWKNFFDRLFMSIESIRKSSDVEICIFDCSEISNENKFFNVSYAHKYLKEDFCRSIVLNTAITFFDSDYYIISDHDIIYKEDFIASKIEFILRKNIELYNPKVMRYEENGNLSKKLLLAPGNIIVSKKLFTKLYGFNEKYYISGFEDCDFIERAKALDANCYFDNDYIISLWHPQWYDSTKYKVNKFIYRNFLQNYIQNKNIDWRTYKVPDYGKLLEVKNE